VSGCPANTAQAGRARGCEGCPGQQFCLSSVAREDPMQRKLDVRMKAISRKILVLSGKGGVGKSSLSAELAACLAVARGRKVALLDVDICGPSAPLLTQLSGSQVTASEYGWTVPSPAWSGGSLRVMSAGFLLAGRDVPVVWRGPRKTSLIRRLLADTFWGRRDFLIIDTPPGTSDEHLSVVASLKNAQPDGAVVVTTPQQLSMATVRKELDFCRKMDIPVLGIVENMSGFACPCCDEVTDIFLAGAGEKLAKECGVPFLGKVPIDQRLSECAQAGESIMLTHPTSAAAKALEEICSAIEAAVA